MDGWMGCLCASSRARRGCSWKVGIAKACAPCVSGIPACLSGWGEEKGERKGKERGGKEDKTWFCILRQISSIVSENRRWGISESLFLRSKMKAAIPPEEKCRSGSQHKKPATNLGGLIGKSRV